MNLYEKIIDSRSNSIHLSKKYIYCQSLLEEDKRDYTSIEWWMREPEVFDIVPKVDLLYEKNSLIRKQTLEYKKDTNLWVESFYESNYSEKNDILDLWNQFSKKYQIHKLVMYLYNNYKIDHYYKDIQTSRLKIKETYDSILSKIDENKQYFL